MNIQLKRLFIGGLVLISSSASNDILGNDTSCSSSLCDACNSGTNCDDIHCRTGFLPFSQGDNLARDYSHISQFQFLPDVDENNWYAALAVEYNRSFDSENLGAYLFPSCNTLTVGPNGTAEVRNVDLGLSNTFAGELTINPRIQNVIIEPAVYIGLDKWAQGLYLWFKVPVVHTSWNLDCCESNSNLGGEFFVPDNLMSNTGPTPVPASGSHQIQEAFGGELTWGDKRTPLNASKILCCKSTKNGVADVPVHFGYNFVLRDRGYVGAYVRAVFPTGTVKNRNSIFDPRIGYDRWQLGGGVNAGVRLHEKDTNTSLYGYLDLHVTYMFKKSECRAFDLQNNGCFSRYLLMQEADEQGNYTGRLVNFVDVFTVCVESKFNWNLDAILFLELRHNNWLVDFGYEIKGRAQETFNDCSCIKLCDPCSDDPCNDNCCQQQSNIFGNKKYGIKGMFPVAEVGDTVQTADSSTIGTSGPLDATPQLIDASNVVKKLDFCTGSIPRTVSHKLWTYFGYTWADHEYPIFAGLGAEVEFGQNNKVLHLWGITGKVGIAFH